MPSTTVTGVLSSWLATSMKAPLSRLASISLGVGLLELGQQPVLFDDQIVVLDGLPHDDRQLVGIPRLGEVAEDVPLVDRVDDRPDIGIGREQEPRRLRPDGLGLAQELDARHLRHPLVGQDHVGDLARPEILERLGAALEGDDAIVDPQQVVDRAQARRARRPRPARSDARSSARSRRLLLTLRRPVPDPQSDAVAVRRRIVRASPEPKPRSKAT